MHSALFLPLFHQSRHFGSRQQPPITRLQMLIVEKTDPHTTQLQDRVPDQLEHATHLLVASLMKQDFVPRIRLRLVKLFDPCGRSARAVLERDAASQSLDPTVSRHAFDFDFVNFLDAIASGCDEISEVAVIREQQETFGVEVEPPDRMQLPERRW